MSDFVIGQVKWFNPTKGYGFVTYEGRDIFIHSKRLRESGVVPIQEVNTISLDIGQKLKFKIVDGEKGKYATEISKA